MPTYTTVDLSAGSFTIPAGVTSVVASCGGAPGGLAGSGRPSVRAPGGGIVGTIAVTPGQVISASLGTPGGLGVTGSPDGRPGSGYGAGGGGRTELKVDGVTMLIGGAGGGAGRRLLDGVSWGYRGGAGGFPDGEQGWGPLTAPATGEQQTGGLPGTQSADGPTGLGTDSGGGGGGFHVGGDGATQRGGGGGSCWADPSITDAASAPGGDAFARITFVTPLIPPAPVIVSPAPGGWVASGDVTIRWQYGGSDIQAAADVEWRPVGGETTPVSVTDASNFVTASLSAGSYECRVRNQSQSGNWGVWTAWTPFGVEDLLDAPVITAPGDGSTVTDVPFGVEWTATGQQALQVQVLDGQTVIDDSGQQDGAASGVTAHATVDGVSLTVGLRIRGAHVWTPWVSVTVTVAWVGPDAPVVRSVSLPDIGAVEVAWTQPDGDVAVDHYEIVAVEAGVPFPVPGASAVDPDARSFIFRLPLSDVDTQLQVAAVAASGAKTVATAP